MHPGSMPEECPLRHRRTHGRWADTRRMIQLSWRRGLPQSCQPRLPGMKVTAQSRLHQGHLQLPLLHGRLRDSQPWNPRNTTLVPSFPTPPPSRRRQDRQPSMALTDVPLSPRRALPRARRSRGRRRMRPHSTTPPRALSARRLRGFRHRGRQPTAPHVMSRRPSPHRALLPLPLRRTHSRARSSPYQRHRRGLRPGRARSTRRRRRRQLPCPPRVIRHTRSAIAEAPSRSRPLYLPSRTTSQRPTAAPRAPQHTRPLHNMIVEAPPRSLLSYPRSRTKRRRPTAVPRARRPMPPTRSVIADPLPRSRLSYLRNHTTPCRPAGAPRH